MWTDQEVSFVNLRTQEAISANYEGTISENTMAHNCFYHIGEQFYFVPFGLNYYFYQINAKKKKLNPIMYLDFGDAEVEDDNLPGRASGKRTDSDEERRKITEDATERYQYLRKSGKTLPLLKFFNDDYVYTDDVQLDGIASYKAEVRGLVGAPQVSNEWPINIQFG
jgi:hypothetical protein